MPHTGPREFTFSGVQVDLDRLEIDNPALVELLTSMIGQLEEQRVDIERALTDTDDLKTNNMRVWMGA